MGKPNFGYGSMAFPHVPPAPGYTELVADGLRGFGLSTDPLRAAAAGE